MRQLDSGTKYGRYSDRAHHFKWMPRGEIAQGLVSVGTGRPICGPLNVTGLTSCALGNFVPSFLEGSGWDGLMRHSC